MASVTKEDGESRAESAAGGDATSALVKKSKAKAESRLEDGANDLPAKRSTPAKGGKNGAPEPGFFTIYKSGQGYWTRMGTVIGATLIAILTAQFLYDQGSVWFKDAAGHTRPAAVMMVVGLFVAIFALVVYRILNRPKVVEFLIATDAEMKKVNWTTRKELIGSTKIVIVFIILIAMILFVYDTVFAQLFHWIGLLLVGPFQRG